MNILFIEKKQIHQGGFTLLESLLALFVNSLVLLLVISLFQTVQNLQESLAHEKNIEWHIFLNQAEYDVSNKKLTNRALQLVEFRENGTGSNYTYELRLPELRRLKEKTGYVPMLTGVQKLEFLNAPGGINIQSTFRNEKVMEGYIPIEKVVEK